MLQVCLHQFYQIEYILKYVSGLNLSTFMLQHLKMVSKNMLTVRYKNLFIFSINLYVRSIFLFRHKSLF